MAVKLVRLRDVAPLRSFASTITAADCYRVPVRLTEVTLIHHSHAVGLSRPGIALSHSCATGLPVSTRFHELMLHSVKMFAVYVKRFAIYFKHGMMRP